MKPLLALRCVNGALHEGLTTNVQVYAEFASDRWRRNEIRIKVRRAAAGWRT
ncbi:hypothetical protein [Burkholderia oklahomensis]|uniref:hypothetical protein n=1 Tax=Burkholderia oklahomensis TaxID=342113 RepID=UPI00016A406A|nr:hypothetical protein [Burkholderia oklahomensis]